VLELIPVTLEEANKYVADNHRHHKALEVNRCCTDGTKNAPSFLYGAAWRATRALGYRKLITYTLPQEGGASLRAVGWKCLGEKGGGNWNCVSRPRIETSLQQRKLCWEAV
jgi:hypothetical protein